jgi:integrase
MKGGAVGKRDEDGIRRRKDGRWEARYAVQTAAGPKRRSVYGKTREEAAAKRDKASAEGWGETEPTFDPDSMRVGAYLDSWLNDSVRGHARPSTFYRHEAIVRLHIKPALGRVKLTVLNPAHVQALYRAKLDEGLSPTTVHRIHEVLHAALKQAARWDLAPRNVCEAVSVPRRRRPDIRPLNPVQARAFLKAAEGDRYEAFFVLALTAGLRLGELRGLCWDAVDLKSGLLQVRPTLVRAGKELVFGEPKTTRGCVVALTPRAVEGLKAHRSRQQAAGLYDADGLVFRSPRAGKPVDHRHLTYRYFRPILERAGLPRIRLHDLRHSCATLLLAGNVNPKIVQELLGHANIAMTLDTYSHILPGMMAPAVDAMEDVLDDAPTKYDHER